MQNLQQLNTQKLIKSLVGYIALVLVLVVVFVIVSISIARAQAQQELQGQYNNQLDKSLEHVAKHYLKDYQNKLERLKETTKLADFMKNRDREGLFKVLNPRYKLLKKETSSLEVMHVHLSDGSSFLRLHEPDIYADMIAPYRPMIQKIHKEHQAISGYEAGKYRNTYRIIMPVFDKSAVYIGAIELGLNPNFMIKAVKEITGLCGVIFVKFDPLKEKVDANTLVIDGFRLDNPQGDKLTKMHKILIKEQLLPQNSIIEVENETYLVHTVALQDFRGEQSIKLLFFQKIQTSNIFLNPVQYSIYFAIFLLLLAALKLIYKRIKTYEKNVTGLYIEKIEEQKSLAKELEIKNELMIAQSRHAEMGEMISMIAHQWRQPLSVIAMDVNNILVDIELELLDIARLQKDVEDINEQTSHLSKTIDDFRNFFKPDRVKDFVAIEDVFMSAYNVMNKSFENHDIKVVNEFTKTPKIELFDRELQQVLINILKNAKEALEDKSMQDKRVTNRIYETEESLVIEVCDNAGGIDASLIDKVFDPYFSTKDEQNGTGLGLYMSKMIVQKHLNATLSAQNRDGGACFTIEIPKSTSN